MRVVCHNDVRLDNVTGRWREASSDSGVGYGHPRKPTSFVSEVEDLGGIRKRSLRRRRPLEVRATFLLAFYMGCGRIPLHARGRFAVAALVTSFRSVRYDCYLCFFAAAATLQQCRRKVLDSLWYGREAWRARVKVCWVGCYAGALLAVRPL